LSRPRLRESTATIVAIVLVALAATGCTTAVAVLTPVAVHRVLPFPRQTAFAGSRYDRFDRIPAEAPAEAPGESPTPTISATATLSPTELQLLRLKALHMAPPGYLLRQGITHFHPYGRREVVLTFDDGPSKNTTEVLSILRQYDVKATFFFVGKRCLGRQDTLRDVLAQGSEIGNHTWTHVSLLAQSLAWDEDQIKRTDDLFFQYTGLRPVWFRPQSGWVDQTGIDAIKAEHKRFVFWDDFGNDTVKTFGPRTIAGYVLEQAHPGSIILLHETNPNTVAALPRILSGLQARGYEITTLTSAMAGD
jgi:peptidoglycan/xylan/chitin deacetylase (PgdA/CDA1 family)